MFKSNIFRRLSFLTSLIIIITILSSCAGGGNTTQPGGETAATNEQTKTGQNDVYKVGDTIKLGDNKLTVNEVKKLQGSEYDKPKSGNEFVIVKVTIENAGKSQISYNPFDFKLENSQGQITDQTFTTLDQDTSLQSGELAPGGKVSGTIPFEAPKNDPKLILQYSPSFWSNDMIKVNLQ